jgi:polysaccharide deacetylase 2 family uncharacterized protein YibQ
MLFGVAVAAFLGGEAIRFLRSDDGTFALARQFGWGDSARLTQVVGRHVRHGLSTVGVARDSIEERAGSDLGARVRWRVGLSPSASLVQANYAIVSILERAGGHVFSGRERPVAGGATEVTLVVGVGRTRTHEIVLMRGSRPDEKSEQHPARIALVLYGFGDDELLLARRLFALPIPFAAAIPPDGKASAEMFQDAHRRAREVILHLPLEPVNYPQVNPGPGTLLVTMKPARIASELRRELAQARPAVAVANLMGSLATQDMSVMTAIYDELKRERLPFIHLNPAPGSVCRPLASQLGVAYDEPGAMFDHEARETRALALDKRWKQLLAALPPGGEQVLWIRATATSAGWLERTMDPKKLKAVDLVPVSALLRKPAAQ